LTLPYTGGTLPGAFEVCKRVLTPPTSFCCLHSSLALVQCCVSSILRKANLDFSYKNDYGYILNPSETKYKYSPPPLHLYLKVKAFLLNSIKPCRPQTSWHYFSIPVSLHISHVFETFQLLPFQFHIKSAIVCKIPNKPSTKSGGESNLCLLLPMRKWPCLVEKPPKLH
jgi:hypothetical protein